MVRVLREIEKRYKVKIPVRMTFGGLNTIKYLTENIIEKSLENSSQVEEGKTEALQEQVPISSVTVVQAEEKITDFIKTVPEEGEKAIAMMLNSMEDNIPVKEARKETPRKTVKSWQSAKTESTKRAYKKRQQSHLDALIRRFNKKTQKSKELTQKYRKILADSKATVGFRMSVKEMLYPVVGSRTEGSRLWDVDGNEYIDITMGFGVHLFGYRPDFIMSTLNEYVKNGLQLGPRSELIGETAELICEFTNMERVAFCNTGTESVMAAIRLARAATGKERIGMFRNSYHGHSDTTLAEGQIESEDGSLFAVTPGIPQSSLKDMLVLDYGDNDSLSKIQQHADELAAVLVEPVQSRDLTLQPVEFLHELRELTTKLGVTLIFDEMITGFRCHPGGAQAFFGIEADIATYGKILGGTLPIGVVAGKAKYLDGIDGGGLWKYGDNSFPEADRTFFGGTFCQYPAVIATANAILNQLKREGPTLQENLNLKTKKFAHTLNEYFKENKIPINVTYFSSTFHFDFEGNLDLFHYHMLERGVYIWEWRHCFLSTAHTDDDIELIIQAAKESAEDLRRGGFLPEDTPKPKNLEYHPPEDLRNLTREQKQLWQIAQMEEDEKAGLVTYNVSAGIRLDGDFNYTVMKNSILRIIKRNDILRSTIEPSKIMQKVLPEFNFELPVVDFSKKRKSTHKKAVGKWLKDFNSRAFNIINIPPFEAAVLKISEKSHILVLKSHHIFVDGITLGIIIEELAELYSAGCEIRTPQLKEPVNVYIEDKDDSNRESNLKYWTEKLSGGVSACNLPYDYSRPEKRIHRGCSRQLDFNQELVDKLHEFAIKNNSTLYALLLSLFSSFLYKISNSEEFFIGTATSGRYSNETERLMGHYVSVLPLGIHIDPDYSTIKYFEEVTTNFFQSLEYEDYSFAELCERVQTDINKFPFTPILFNMDKIPDTITFTDLKTEWFSIPVSYVDKDLFLNFIEWNGRLTLECNFSSELFDPDTIDRILQYFSVYIENSVNNPERSIAEQSIISDEELQKILIEFNDTGAPYPKDKTVHQLFEEQVEKTPDNVAVVFEDKKLTYRELNERANQLAHTIRKEYRNHWDEEVKKDTMIGLYIDRSLDIIVGILGILKSGAAYVPFDTADPEERLKFKINDCGCKMVLTSSGRTENLVFLMETDTLPVAIDKYWTVIGKEPKSNPEHINKSTDLAYVIYTSGSTGKPKGVMIEHFSINNLVKNSNYIDILKTDTIACLASIAFDAVTFEIWGPLLNGASCVLFTKESVLSEKKIKNEFTDKKVKKAFITTALFNQLTLSANNNPLFILDDILFGGEACNLANIQNFLSKNNKTRLVHVYGPTEATTFACYCDLKEKIVQNCVPIGKALSGNTLYVLDTAFHPVPIGMPGELYIGGDGLARGYLNRPELTKKRFIENSFASDEDRAKNRNLRIYKTGDLVRWLPDGNLEFLGRNDNQIKIRGYRIELDGIENCMLKIPGIQNSTIIVKTDDYGDKYMVAFYTGRKLRSKDIKNSLKISLPEYMIPAFFMFLETLPINTSGKIDKDSLKEIKLLSEAVSQTEILPHNVVKLRLVKIWISILKDRYMTDHDKSYFDIGGNSMSAVRLVSMINENFGENLLVNWTYKNNTINKQEKYLINKNSALNYQPVINFNINHRASSVPLIFIHPGLGSAELYCPFTSYLNKDQAFYGIESYNFYNTDKPIKTISGLAELYLKHILSFISSKPIAIGGWSIGGNIALEIANQLVEKNIKIHSLYLLDSHFLKNSEMAKDYRVGLKINNSALYNELLKSGKYGKRLLSLGRIEYESLKAYSPKPYNGKATLFKAKYGFRLKGKNPFDKKDNGWSNLIDDLNIKNIEGDHYSIISDSKQIEEIADAIQSDLI